MVVIDIFFGSGLSGLGYPEFAGQSIALSEHSTRFRRYSTSSHALVYSESQDAWQVVGPHREEMLRRERQSYACRTYAVEKPMHSYPLIG
ncbi:MAG: hypothetical protein DDT30_01125 [Dehalococcoidia bacterium]|nr:hypothetical protein [Bacillota bacterium]MBT9166229.1 hypothetical protein [Chloroflexota bacterium]